jgi:hypothetical protein
MGTPIRRSSSGGRFTKLIMVFSSYHERGRVVCLLLYEYSYCSFNSGRTFEVNLAALT